MVRPISSSIRTVFCLEEMTAVEELQRFLTTPSASLPVHLHGNSIAIAHSALQTLRDAGDEQFLFLRSILELYPQLRPDQEELFFHCVTGFRQVILAQWKNLYSPVFIQRSRDFFMSLGHRLPQNRTCRLACYTTSVSFWKRGWDDKDSVEASGVRLEEQKVMESITALQAPVLNSSKELFSYLEQQFQSQQCSEAAAFLTCLVGEFSGKSSVTYAMPLEFHKAAHRSFEKEGALFHSLQLSMHTLNQIVVNFAAPDPSLIEQTHTVVQLILEVLSWEFGMTAFASGSLGAIRTGQTLIRPPVQWRDYLVRPELGQALFSMHQKVRNHEHIAHSIRQLLLILASLSGPIFTPHDTTERQKYASSLAQGTVELLQTAAQAPAEDPILLGSLQLVSRLIANFRLSTLVGLPPLIPLLQGLVSAGHRILEEQVRDCEQAGGDVEAMEYRDWREDVLSVILEAAVVLCGDPWLLYSEPAEARKEAQRSLSTVLGPLYEGFVQNRTRMAALEEHYAMVHETELDEIREEIIEADLEEELASVAVIGRLNLSAAIACLSNLFSATMPQLESLWRGNGEVTPELSALLEQARLLNLYIMHLLSDNNEGESPTIPDAVAIACQDNPSLSGEIASAVQALFSFADAQVHKIAENPTNRRLSPFLACSFLLFLNRWAPAYIFPESSRIQEWRTEEKAQHAVSFCVTLCLHYECYWPQEQQVQQHVADLLMSLAKKGPRVRSLIVACPSFCQMVQFHCLTAGIRHSASRQEFEATVRPHAGDAGLPSIHMMWGYQRLPYKDKSRLVTAILIACSDTNNQAANTMINSSLKAIHDAFTSLVQALSSKQVAFDDVNAKEMACLCVEMMRGVTHASEMANSERIPQLLTTYLPQLSSLMVHYAEDLTICEALLRFFGDYTEHFMTILDRDQSVALFQAAAELLRGYSAHHCTARVIPKKSSTEAAAEEEQTYSDILCAIQLLINIGTKDFLDADGSGQGVQSSQVTDLVCFGLQQILPLMTQGLLQFPTLCSQFFEFIGFMMDTYPEKVCSLPYDLLNSMLESLMFGMSHHDTKVAHCSLYGLASIAQEHISSQALRPHLEARPDILDQCAKRLLAEVVFQPIVVDRVEAAGMALLPLAAYDVNRFANVVQELTGQIPDPSHRVRLGAAFHTLLQPETLTHAAIATKGYEARMHRVRFKNHFEEFVNEVHSFLVRR